jgi:hypothetical protein
MPEVTCTNCHTKTHVRFQRGIRLANVPCPGCFEHTLAVSTKGATTRAKGRTYQHCARCGRRGLDLAQPPFRWEPRYGSEELTTGMPPWGRFDAGTRACRFEEAVPANGRVRFADATAIFGGEHRSGTREEATRLLERAAVLPDACPNCAPFGDPWNKGFCTEARWFDAGLVLVADCISCGHTIVRAAPSLEVPR